MPDPGSGSDVADPDELTDQAKVARLCALLRSATATPDDSYFAIWEGWPNSSALMRQSARMHIPNRSYYLLRGSLSEFGQWGVPEMGHNPAAFVWPADHAWCIASDVDDHWASVGASAAVIEGLLINGGLDIVTADPDLGDDSQYSPPAGYFRRR